MLGSSVTHLRPTNSGMPRYLQLLLVLLLPAALLALHSKEFLTTQPEPATVLSTTPAAPSWYTHPADSAGSTNVGAAARAGAGGTATSSRTAGYGTIAAGAPHGAGNLNLNPASNKAGYGTAVAGPSAAAGAAAAAGATFVPPTTAGASDGWLPPPPPPPPPPPLHKPLWPLVASDWLGFAASTLGLLLAAGGGVGGGGMLVPIYILVMGFSAKYAIPLSNLTVLGGAVMNFILNLRKVCVHYLVCTLQIYADQQTPQGHHA